MKLLKLLLPIFILSTMTNLTAQENAVPNEYIIYMTDGSTTADVETLASTWNSIVLQNLTGATNIAVFEHNGEFPMENPYNPGEQIYDLIGVVGKIKKHEPGGDGGSLNYEVGGNIPGNVGNSCYDDSFNNEEIGSSSIVRLAVFDTGTNWDAANELGFNFGTPYEMFGDASDKHGHGTHVASVVNGTYLNSEGGTTTTNVQYILGNPLGSNGTSTLAEMVLSMEEAIIHGANVINCSFSYYAPKMTFGSSSTTTSTPHGEDDVLYLLMSSADPTKTLFVVSAGNNYGYNLDGEDTHNVYPAAFPLENMITVASYNCLHDISDFSNYGAATTKFQVKFLFRQILLRAILISNLLWNLVA